MRTQDEIVERMRDRQQNDFLGFETSEYIAALEYERAKEFLKEGVTAEEFAKAPALRTREAVVKKMRDYVDFAYGKIDGERGISANRTILHYVAWLWLAGEDDLLAWVEHEYETNYHGYGRHIVDRIVEQLQLRAPEPSHG